MTLDIAIEGVLFYKANAIKKQDFLKLFSCTAEELSVAIVALRTRLESGATRLLETEAVVQIVTAPEMDELIESIRKDELRRDIGKAGAETLAIVLYKGPITRVEIDRIRGVNSGFILRNLLVRGLVDRTAEGKSHAFTITPDLLAHLGLVSQHDLPDYASVLDKLEKFEQEETAAQNNE